MITLNQLQKLPKAALWYWLAKLVIICFLISAVCLTSGFKIWLNEFFGLLVIIGIPFSIFFILKYNYFSFLVEEGRLTINSGIIFKRSKTINAPIIQNIESTRGPISSMFGISRLKVWTANPAQKRSVGKGKEEVRPDGSLDMTTEDATWLKDVMLKKADNKYFVS